jgi:mannose/fructose/N-acetylgalactosamine-specific phosphotransferase system component IID
LATFAALAAFYLGSVIFQLISWGWSWTLDAARAESALAYSLAARVIGGLLSLVLFVLCMGGPRWNTLRTYLAWGFTLGVTIVVIVDTQSSEPATAASQAVVWVISAGVIAVHLFGAIVARRVTVE